MWFLLLAVLVAVAAPVSASGKKTSIKNTGFNCECVDIIFDIDVSGSIDAQEWQSVLDFLCNFMFCFRNPPNDVRFAAVKFATTASVVFDLGNSCNTDKDGNFLDCKDLISALPLPSGATNLAESLEVINDSIIGGNGDREDVRCPDVVVILTDGNWNVGGDPTNNANILKNKGVAIVPIGIGNFVDYSTLASVASDKDFILTPFSFVALLKLVDDLKILVCDTIHYDPACQTCCCGVIYGGHKKQLPDRRNKCCGRKHYDGKRATCCQGRLNEGLDEHWARCCYDKAYDPRHATCCYNKIVPATRSQDQCCGFTAYNQKHQICCYGRVFRKTKHTMCCGSVAYNKKWEICCRYRVQEGCEAEHRCCGYRSYNPRRYICCNPYYSYIRPSPIKYCGQDITLYCGYYKSWDPLWNTCCCGRVWPGAVDHNTGCCRTRRYELNKALCCDGLLYNKDPEWFRCCGRRFYDPWTQTCCNGYYVVEGKGLCCGPYQIFDHRNQICCGYYYVFNGRPSHTKCCYSYYYGYRPYDIKTQLCCYGYVQPGGKHYRCCRWRSYNLKTHMCCYGRVFSRKVFRLLHFCDNPRDGISPLSPFDALPADESAQEPKPTDEPPVTPEFVDEDEDKKGSNGEDDRTDEPFVAAAAAAAAAPAADAGDAGDGSGEDPGGVP